MTADCDCVLPVPMFLIFVELLLRWLHSGDRGYPLFPVPGKRENNDQRPLAKLTFSAPSHKDLSRGVDNWPKRRPQNQYLEVRSHWHALLRKQNQPHREYAPQGANETAEISRAYQSRQFEIPFQSSHLTTRIKLSPGSRSRRLRELAAADRQSSSKRPKLEAARCSRSQNKQQTFCHILHSAGNLVAS